jgi:hypothetical protein
MATQPKPKPKPSPEPPEPEPGEDDAAVGPHAGPPQPPDPTGGPVGRGLVFEEPPQTDTNATGNSLTDRLDALFTSHVALIERVERLEERVNAPPIGLGKRP